MEPVIRTFYSYLTDLAGTTPKKKLLGHGDTWLDAATVLDRVDATVIHLRSLGLTPGDLVILPAGRDLGTALTIFASQALGLLAVLTDPRQEPLTFLNTVGVTLPVKTVLDPSRFDIFSLPSAPCGFTEQDPRAPGFIIFTSGSTGKAKAVTLSQYNLVNNLIDSQPLGDYAADDIALGALPMDHVFGLVLLAGAAVLGYAVYFSESKDVSFLLQTIQQQQITRMNGVPSLYLAMAEQAENYDLSSLRCGFVGGGPCTQAQFCRIEEALSMTLIPVYGMSECIGISCADYKMPQKIRAQGVGAPYAMNQCRILREDGTSAGPGESGEICVRGPSRMIGYYPQTLPPEEFLHTEDLGYLDAQGILHLTGRKKDIIIRNGINLSARKIEEALLSIPGVSDAAVVGVPDSACGEVPVAMVVCPEDHLRRVWIALHDHLQKNELPAELIRTPALPRTAAGKPDKHRVREVLMKWKA